MMSGHRVGLVVARQLRAAAHGIGAWSGWINNQRWEEIFWLIAMLPSIGIIAWAILSRNREPGAQVQV